MHVNRVGFFFSCHCAPQTGLNLNEWNNNNNNPIGVSIIGAYHTEQTEIGKKYNLSVIYSTTLRA